MLTPDCVCSALCPPVSGSGDMWCVFIHFKVSLFSRRGFESSQNTAPATSSKRSSAFPAHICAAPPVSRESCPHKVIHPFPFPRAPTRVAPLHTLVT
eukprot:scaffold108729_cov45-Phaeocystis_antarctica.AAC.1